MREPDVSGAETNAAPSTGIVAFTSKFKVVFSRSATHAAPSPSLQSSLPKIAVCLVGETRSLWDETNGGSSVLASILRNIVEPLEADVFVSTSDDRWRRQPHENIGSFNNDTTTNFSPPSSPGATHPHVDSPISRNNLLRKFASSPLSPYIKDVKISRPSPSLRTGRQPSCTVFPDDPMYDSSCSLDLDSGCPAMHAHAHADAPQFEQWSDCERMIKLHSAATGLEYAAVVRWRPDVRPLSPFPARTSLVWSKLSPEVVYVPSIFHTHGGLYGGFARDVYAVYHPSLHSVLSSVADTMWECIPLQELLQACGDGVHVSAVTWCECVYTVHLHRCAVGFQPWPQLVEEVEGYRGGEWAKVQAADWVSWRQKDGKWYRT
jgi:hypothetical protein